MSPEPGGSLSGETSSPLSSYQFADCAVSAQIHRALYSDKIIDEGWLVPVDLDFRFRFACVGTGNCCRERTPAMNTVQLYSDVRKLVHHCRAKQIPLSGLLHGKVLFLDGLTKTQRIKQTDPPGRKYLLNNLTCQFLTAESKCGVYAARPLLCRLAPIGFAVDHDEKIIALAFIAEFSRRCPECFATEKETSVRGFIEGVFTPELLREMREYSIVGGAG